MGSVWLLFQALIYKKKNSEYSTDIAVFQNKSLIWSDEVNIQILPNGI